MIAAKSAAMKKLVIQILTAMLLTIAALSAFAKGASAGDVSVVDARVTHVTGAPTGSAYFTVVNKGSQADALIGIASDAAEGAMLHQSTNENNVMRMRMVERLELKPGETIDLHKIGMHVMLVGLKGPLQSGDRVRLHLTFENAGIMDVEAVVAQ
jgi:periplasmic copper chaperone A